MPAPATGSEIAQFSDVGLGSPTVSGADPVLGGCLFAPSEATAPTVRNDLLQVRGVCLPCRYFCEELSSCRRQ
jgi:hypothetical protein